MKPACTYQMKKMLSVGAAAFAVAALLVVPAFADEQSSPSPKSGQDQQKQSTEDRVRDLEKKKEQLEERRRTKNQERIQKFWEQMEKRLSVLIRNEKKLAERIDSQIAKRTAAGADMADTSGKLKKARTLIADAEKSLTDAASAITKIISGNEPKDAFAKVRNLNKDVLDKIKAAHKALVDVFSQVKQARPTPTPEP